MACVLLSSRCDAAPFRKLPAETGDGLIGKAVGLQNRSTRDHEKAPFN